MSQAIRACDPFHCLRRERQVASGTMSLRDRLSSLTRGELIGLVLVLAVTLGGAGVWYARSLPRPVAIGAPSRSNSAAGARAASPSESPSSIIVDVAGEVKRPGVYEL